MFISGGDYHFTSQLCEDELYPI